MFGSDVDHEIDTMPALEELPGPNDITEIPEDLTAEDNDGVGQYEILENIIANTRQLDEDAFNKAKPKVLRLSQLQRMYGRDGATDLNLLSNRNILLIDDQFKVDVGKGQLSMKTDDTKLDFHMTVANCIGLSALLPNEANSYRYSFEMDLKKPYREFKGKHAMVGFDTQGKVLYIGKSMNEDVFLAMAPNSFFSQGGERSPPGYSTGSSVLTRRHYRQIIMMFAHFLALIPDRAYVNIGNVYSQDLNADDAKWSQITDILYVISCLVNTLTYAALTTEMSLQSG